MLAAFRTVSTVPVAINATRVRTGSERIVTLGEGTLGAVDTMLDGIGATSVSPAGCGATGAGGVQVGRRILGNGWESCARRIQYLRDALLQSLTRPFPVRGPA